VQLKSSAVKICMFLLIAIFSSGCGGGGGGTTNTILTSDTKIPIKTSRPPVKNLPAGWTQDVLYSNVCASPVGMTPGEGGCQSRKTR